MTLRELAELSIFIGLVVLLVAMLFGAVRFRPSKLRGLSWRQRIRRLGRYTLVRLPIGIGFGLAVFVLGASGITLNSHRPPADTDPVVVVPPGTTEATVSLRLGDCLEPVVSGTVRISGVRGLAKRPIRFYSDGGGWQRLELESRGRSAEAEFRQQDATHKRSLLSCYLQLPVVKGMSGPYRVRLKLSGAMEVDRDTSVPSPQAYSAGAWIWECREGRKCPAFATVGYSIEGGTKQVIMLVLASIFGALIALFVGEIVIEWARRRVRRD